MFYLSRQRHTVDSYNFRQCSGSDPHVFWPPGSGSLYYQAKRVRKTLIPTVLWLLLDFLSLKNVLSKSNKQKNFFYSFLLASWRSMRKTAGSGSASGSISQRYGSADTDPDSHQNFMDPEHWFSVFFTLKLSRKQVLFCITRYIWLKDTDSARSALDADPDTTQLIAFSDTE